IPDGFGQATWGQQEVTASFNDESRVLWVVTVGSSYRGTLSFKSRAGGAFGAHEYVVGVGFVQRDGQDFPIDWSNPKHPEFAEIQDGMLATFKPDAAPDTNCIAAKTCLAIADAGTNSIFGNRTLGFYLEFQTGTNAVSGFYAFQKGGKPDCTTPS